MNLKTTQIAMLCSILDGSALDVGAVDEDSKAKWGRLAARGLVLFTSRRFVSITREGRDALMSQDGELAVYTAQCIEDARARRAGHRPRLITTPKEAKAYVHDIYG